MIVGITEKTQHHLGKNTVSQQIRDGGAGRLVAGGEVSSRCEGGWGWGGGVSVSLQHYDANCTQTPSHGAVSPYCKKKKESRPDRRPGEARRPSSSLRTEKPQHLMSHDQNSPRFSSSRGDNRKPGDRVTSLCTMTDLKRR